jgi:hypothetical protein
MVKYYISASQIIIIITITIAIAIAIIIIIVIIIIITIPFVNPHVQKAHPLQIKDFGPWPVTLAEGIRCHHILPQCQPSHTLAKSCELRAHRRVTVS